MILVSPLRKYSQMVSKDIKNFRIKTDKKKSSLCQNFSSATTPRRVTGTGLNIVAS